MSSTSGVGSGTTSAASGTLGNAPPVSFPGVSSGIDYNSIIEKYTADTLLQEQPVKTQITNLNAQNTALLKITNLIGSVQDSLTALSDPTTFGAFSADVSNTASGSPAATGDAGQRSNAERRYLHDQRADRGDGDDDPQQPERERFALGWRSRSTTRARQSIAASNGTGSNNGVVHDQRRRVLNYNVTTQTISTIVSNINAALASQRRRQRRAERERHRYVDRRDHDRQRRRSAATSRPSSSSIRRSSSPAPAPRPSRRTPTRSRVHRRSRASTKIRSSIRTTIQVSPRASRAARSRSTAFSSPSTRPKIRSAISSRKSTARLPALRQPTMRKPRRFSSRARRRVRRASYWARPAIRAISSARPGSKPARPSPAPKRV